MVENLFFNNIINKNINNNELNNKNNDNFNDAFLNKLTQTIEGSRHLTMIGDESLQNEVTKKTGFVFNL